MSQVEEIKSCRLCGSEKLSQFIHFPAVPLANCYLDDGLKVPKFDLTVVSCDECDSHQLKQTIDPSILFGDFYAYSTPPSLSNHFRDFAGTVIRDLNLNDKSVIVDIGGNNGLLCSYFKQLSEDVYNIEPSKNIAKESRAKGIYTLDDFLDEGLFSRMGQRHQRFNLIFSNDKYAVSLSPRKSVDVAISANVFAHSPKVFEMMSVVKRILKPGGVFVQENAFWLKTLQNADLGQIYGEHVFYHHITPLFKVYEKLGMTLYHVEFNDAQCGSFRIYVKNFPNYPVEQSVKDCMAVENDPLVKQSYQGLQYAKSNFLDGISRVKKNIIDFLDHRSGKKIGLVGVPAKSALMLSYFGIADRFWAAYEDASLKVNKQVPGTTILIKPMEELVECDLWVVGAYNFSDHLINKFRNVAKGEWCVPLPNFAVYDTNSVDPDGEVSVKYVF